MSRMNFNFGANRVSKESAPFPGHDFNEAALAITVHADGTETYEPVYPVIRDSEKDVRGAANLVLNMGPGRPINIDHPAENN